MSTGVTWECSSTFFSAVRAATKELGQLDLVRAQLDFTSREVVDGLHRQAWWPGQHVVAFFLALEQVGGPGTARRAGVLAAHHGMGKLVRPLTGALLAFSRSPLEALLSRLGTFANLGTRGVTTTWAKTGPGVGRASFTFPEPVDPIMAEQWYGMFDLGFQLAKQGSIAKVTIEPAQHHFDVQWA